MAEKFEKSFNSWLRKSSRKTARQSNVPLAVKCPLCNQEVPDATEALYGKHVRDNHAEVVAESTDEKSGSGGTGESRIRELWTQAAKGAKAGIYMSVTHSFLCFLPGATYLSTTRQG